MKCLAIETSCDETSAAITKDGTTILSNIVATQTEFHQKYGGIVPEIAARKHIELINPIIQEALDKANTAFKDLDAVAVTYGPGLVGSLIVGLCAAKAIAWSQKIPLIGINHLEGHIYANLLMSNSLPLRAGPISNFFPFICLLVSGGHTMIVHVKNHGEYETLGQTRDDAAGEAFDKVARVLGLGYPGGPLIDKLSKDGNPNAIQFKHPMIEGEYAYDFSFSGIKTAVVNYVRKEEKHKTQNTEHGLKIADIAASFQKVVVETLVEKLIKAAKDKKVSTVSIAGGVSANSGLRNYLQKRAKAENLNVIIPSFEYCTDNAAMIGCAAYYKFKLQKVSDFSIKPIASLKI